MRKNIFAKSLSRKVIQAILLMLLLFLASFIFSMRGVEYLNVTQNVNEISRFYRAIGTITNRSVETLELIAGADLVSASPYVEFEDRRRGFLGVLPDMTNSDASFMFCVYTTANLTEINDIFFYGTLIEQSREEDVGHFAAALLGGEETWRINLTVLVDEVLNGHPEHIASGQNIQLRLYPDGLPLLVSRRVYENPLMPGSDVLNELEIGQRYLFRGASYRKEEDMFTPPHGGWPLALVMRPLNENTTYQHGQRSQFRRLEGEAIWYIPVEQGEVIDFSRPGLERLSEELEHLRFCQSSIRLMTTEDMTAIPFVQTEEKRLARGRWIERDDVLEQRAVAVVSAAFGHARNVRIGDTLRIGVPTPQSIPRVLDIRPDGSSFDDYLHVSPPGEDFDMLLELEVVGLYHYSGRAYFLNNFDFMTSYSTFVYIPNSLIPEDFSYEYAWIGNDSHIQDATPGVDFQYQSWYSFVLTDTRIEDNFMVENEEALAAMGILVRFIPTNADVFWQSAEGILQAVTFNFITFTLLTIMILLLIGFLYMRQSRKDFAILRALGLPKKKALKQYVGTLFIFGLPSALLGSVGGGIFALQQVGNILNPLGEIEPYADINISVGYYWLFAFGVIAFSFLLLVVVLWGIRIGSRSVLELLQGNTAKKRG
jgi:hypothetical protein